VSDLESMVVMIQDGGTNPPTTHIAWQMIRFTDQQSEIETSEEIVVGWAVTHAQACQLVAAIARIMHV
jgi:hypothetical protein